MLITQLARRILKIYPLNTPRYSLLRLLPRVPSHLNKFSIRDGLVISGYTPGDDHVCKSLYWLGDFDPWVSNTLVRLLRSGEVACDIGANIGATALPMGKAVGEIGQVYCFEPVPKNLELLEKNIASNFFTTIHVKNIALSNADGELIIHVPNGQPGMASVNNSKATHDDISVTACRFDDWIDATSISHVAVCKIDVEGHEELVLEGMSKSLSDGKISAILFEHHYSSKGKDSLISYLEKFNYEIFRIHKGLTKTHYIPFGAPSKGKPTSDWVACLRNSDALRRLLFSN